jgi:thiol:disulfide interchange protein DsbA
MNRREFSSGAAGGLAAAALGLPGWAAAQNRTPRDGTEYRTLDKRAPVETPAGKIEVVEFFWYSCPHCNRFEPQLVEWIKRQPADVVVRRVPVAFRDDFEPQQRLFYTLEAMGRLGDLHDKVFADIHANRKPTNRQDLIVAFAEANGLDRAKFLEQYNSFTIASKARRATALQEAYRVAGVPSLGIAGRYYTDGDMAGTMERALQVADHLVAEARKAK